MPRSTKNSLRAIRVQSDSICIGTIAEQFSVLDGSPFLSILRRIYNGQLQNIFTDIWIFRPRINLTILHV